MFNAISQIDAQEKKRSNPNDSISKKAPLIVNALT